jgi:N-acetylglucosamine-6-phosphate deacetylase
MSDQWLAPDGLFDGQRILTGQAVRIAGGRITDIAPAAANATPIKGCLTPGFIDLQVNGGGGVLLNSSPTAQGMAAIAAAHRSFGTVALMPTVITDHPDALDQAADAAIAAKGTFGLMGLHIEGPHIVLAKRGTHAAEHIRPLDDRTFATVERLRDAKVATLITLAPEAANPDKITQLSAMGAVVSLGHTDATAEAVETAIKAGATCATHLFNAMSQMQGRAPGAVGAVLTSNIHAGLICDGHHVDDPASVGNQTFF